MMRYAFLGPFPLIAKKLIGIVTQRRARATMIRGRPKRFDAKLIVIGAGSAGSDRRR
jgi:hypothetical protein